MATPEQRAHAGSFIVRALMAKDQDKSGTLLGTRLVDEVLSDGSDDPRTGGKPALLGMIWQHWFDQISGLERDAAILLPFARHLIPEDERAAARARFAALEAERKQNVERFASLMTSQQRDALRAIDDANNEDQDDTKTSSRASSKHSKNSKKQKRKRRRHSSSSSSSSYSPSLDQPSSKFLASVT